MNKTVFTTLIAVLLAGVLSAAQVQAQDMKQPEEEPKKDAPPDEDFPRGEKNPLGPAEIPPLEPIGGGDSEITYPPGPTVPGK